MKKNHIGAFALLLPLALAGVGSALAVENDVETSAAMEGEVTTGAGTEGGVAVGTPTEDGTETDSATEGDITTGTDPEDEAETDPATGSDVVTGAATECSVATLHGTYLFAYQGVTVKGNPRGPFAVAGFEVYDGQGNVRSVSTSSSNGKIDRNVRTKGKYTVNANCTGSVRYSDGTRYDQFLAPDGSTFVFIQTNPGTVAAGFEPRATAQKVKD
jgi:hypothetical protein